MRIQIYKGFAGSALSYKSEAWNDEVRLMWAEGNFMRQALGYTFLNSYWNEEITELQIWLKETSDSSIEETWQNILQESSMIG